MMFFKIASWTVLLTVTFLSEEVIALSTVLLLTPDSPDSPDSPLKLLKAPARLGVGVLLRVLLRVLSSRLRLLDLLLLDLDLSLYLALVRGLLDLDRLDLGLLSLAPPLPDLSFL